MTPQDFDYLRQMLREYSGLVLSAEKQYLAESRLLSVARRHGLATLGELVGKLKAATVSPLNVEVVEAMTTNETFFFRDKVPFDHFRESIMPEILQARAARKSIRIWCAAGSTGQDGRATGLSAPSHGCGAAGAPALALLVALAWAARRRRG